MTSILVDNFGGESPRIDSRLLPPNGAQTAKNCDLRSGKIVPDSDSLIEEAGISADTKTIYFRHISGLADGWRTWSNLTYFFESPFAKETKARLYTLGFVDEGTDSTMQYEGTDIGSNSNNCCNGN